MLGVLSLLLMALGSLCLAQNLAASVGLILALAVTASVCAVAAGLIFSPRVETLVLGLVSASRGPVCGILARLLLVRHDATRAIGPPLCWFWRDQLACRSSGSFRRGIWGWRWG
jgi:hypothetical protein